jgi:hypothetical protein
MYVDSISTWDLPNLLIDKSEMYYNRSEATGTAKITAKRSSGAMRWPTP